MFHMGWFLKQGFGVQGWGAPWSGVTHMEWMQPDPYIDMAKQLERASFDYMMIEDSLLVHDTYKGSAEFPLRRAYSVPKSDPMPLIPLIAHATQNIGIIGTIATPFIPPFSAARLGATLDHLTKGRVGLNLVTASSHRSAQNYGLEKHYEHDERYRMADEWMEVVEALWNSWEPDAIVADPETGVYADHNKVHTIDFVGKYYKCRGPLNTAPGPQRKPVICQAGGSPAGMAFATKYADTIVASKLGIEAMKGYRAEITERLVRNQRPADSAKVLFLIAPILAETDEEAFDRRDRQRKKEAEDWEARVERMSYMSGIDFGQFELDEPLPDDLLPKINGHQSGMKEILSKGATLRELTKFTPVESIELVGSPDTVAAKMGEAMEEIGGDGFLITNTITRRTVAEIAEGLAPALKQRGLTRKAYEPGTFRENLLAF
ncbi:FMNH2-dependent monooxygenase [Acuticoccus sediminis]|uniref:FMNH2-dependent monooxygenase n=1 Tax=Acuticoccus sediminis TaxID=2184697 RepID=A0A8B2NEU2_9HYPH|nr:NtaA/DmoA family FMN-dependent monooxygenase [Acuticoccus sediminis]RAH97377.1 FMNH2-dependent monooxygenase [Acuticoccus sediminis]